LICPRCGSRNVKVIDLTLLTPELGCDDCGLVWTLKPESFGEGLAGDHPRDFELKWNQSKVNQHDLGGLLRAILPFLILVLLAAALGLTILNYWPA